MACSGQGKRIASISHGGTTLASPHGGSITEQVVPGESRPGTRKSPCAYIKEYALRAIAIFGEMVTPIVRGTTATLTYTIQDMAESSNITIAVATMMMLNASFDFNSEPEYKQQYEFSYNPGDSENIAPITVS